MHLTEKLKAAIDRELSTPAGRKLQHASEELSARYRTQPSDKIFMSSDAHRLAYLAARLPATYAAVHAVLSEWAQRQPDVQIRSLLDIGSGPATALWAAIDVFPTIEKATAIEQDGDLIKLAQRLLKEFNSLKIEWRHEPMQQWENIPRHDAAIFSYSIGELSEKEQLLTLSKAWETVDKALVIIEPGTPKGFERIRIIRSWLLDAGAFLVAPCPNALACPMAKGNWCHFAARLERSAEHRQIKGGTLNYEDEKYSYLIVSKTPVALPQERILRHPQKRSGHVNFTVCTEGEVVQQTFSKRDGEAYKKTRKLEWGDVIP